MWRQHGWQTRVPDVDPVRIWGQTEWRYCTRKGGHMFNAQAMPAPQLNMNYVVPQLLHLNVE